MVKVKLTKRQADALEQIIAEKGREYAIRFRSKIDRGLLDTTSHSYLRQLQDLDELDYLTFVSAVINGWEVVKSPKELLQQEYRQRLLSPDMVDRGWCSGVKVALNATGQYVQGINT